MIGQATITVFQYPEGDHSVTIVRVSLVENSTGEHCHSWERVGPRCLHELLSLASDAVLSWQRHGAMYAEPLESGWRRGL